MTVGDVGDSSGNIMCGLWLYLRDDLLVDMMKTQMRAKTTFSLKKGQLCRTSDDGQIREMSLINDQQNEDYSSNDDNDPAMMTCPKC